MNEELTEEQAKKILDFLARRIGAMRISTNISLVAAVVVWEEDEHGNIIFSSSPFTFLDKMQCASFIGATDSYVALLDIFLNMSKNGNKIMASPPGDFLDKRVLLPANVSLEELLVECDFGE